MSEEAWNWRAAQSPGEINACQVCHYDPKMLRMLRLLCLEPLADADQVLSRK